MLSNTVLSNTVLSDTVLSNTMPTRIVMRGRDAFGG
jgi:hypothetical protein